MNRDAINSSHLLTCLEDILDSDPHIDEVGFIDPSQFAAFNDALHTSPSLSSRAAAQLTDEINATAKVQASSSDSFFWHSEHKLGISTHVLVPLYNAAKDGFMDAYKRYRMLNDSQAKNDGTLDNSDLVCWASTAGILESEVMKHSRALLLLSCDFGTAWNFRKLILSKKMTLPMLMDELHLSTLVLSYSPKSERAWSHRRWVIKIISRKWGNLQDIVEGESNLVKALAERSKMNYRAWNHRCWLVPYMSDSQVLLELQSSQEWAGHHVADNSCFHYRARLLLQMIENSRRNDPGSFPGSGLHRIWKEELEWIEMLIRRYVGREALWLHRRFLSLVWVKHLAVDCRSKCCHSHCKICDISTFIKNELMLFRSCTIIPDDDFGDYQAQATYVATYISWLAKQMPMCFREELQRGSHLEALETLLNDAGKSCLWESVSASCTGTLS